MKKFINSLWLAASGMAISIVPAWAADPINIGPKGQFQPLVNITIPKVVSGLISLVLVVAALIFFFMLVIGGIRWMLSGGDKAATEGARGQITAALIGLIIVFSAWAIIQLIKTLFGIDIISLEIPSFQ